MPAVAMPSRVRLSQCQNSSNKLTLSSGLVNSTDEAFHNGLNYDRFLGPDSKVALSLQHAIQKLQEQETAPVCNKMASSALIHTCATLTGDGETQDATENMLHEEIKLFAARLAVCELSDSSNRNIVPAECGSFIPTEMNTKKKGWFGFVSSNGHKKSVPRYPDYDQNTRQDLEQCVDALQNSPQTWSSYSNAKQSANQWCPAVRGDVEKDKLLQMYGAFTEIMALHDDALRSQSETLRQQMEATRFLSTQLRKFAQDTMETSEAVQKMWSDVENVVRAGTQNVKAQLQEQTDLFNAALQDQDIRFRAMGERWIVGMQDAMAQHTRELALAQSQNAEDAREQVEYASEMFQQRLLQLFFNASNMAQELTGHGTSALQTLQQIKYQASNVDEKFAELSQSISDATTAMQQLQDNQKELDLAMNSTKHSLAAFEARVLAISDSISAAFATVSGILDYFPAVAWCFPYLVGAGVFLALRITGGWSILCLMLTSVYKWTSVTAGCIGKLAEPIVSAAGSSLCIAVTAMKSRVDWKVALIMILSVTATAVYCMAVETPLAYFQRWENGEMSLFEPVNITMIGVVVLVLLGIISNRVVASRESESFQAGEPYDTKESAV